MAQLLLHLANITIYENTFITDSREFPFPWEFPGIPDLLFPFPGNPVTIVMDSNRRSYRLPITFGGVGFKIMQAEVLRII